MRNEGPGRAEVRRRVSEYVAHLEEIARVFNEHAEKIGLGIRLDAQRAIDSVEKGHSVAQVTKFCDRRDDAGVLHDVQLMTALDCIRELLMAPRKNGLILGAMQSGKTTTSLALQLAGPIVYLLTGRCLYPIYLITSHTSQEDQTQIEIHRFIEFYGELAVTVDNQRRCTIIEYVQRAAIDAFFAYSPTINTYREHVLKRALPDTMMGPRLEDCIQRRAKGKSIRDIVDLCRRANSQGFAPLLIIDEPQFGASDRLVRVCDDEFERRPCVLLQIFERIDEALGRAAKDRVFIGLSATPFELHDLSAVWKVKQHLNSSYSGFNYFGGQVIDADADVTPPRTVSFVDFAREIRVPFLKKISLPAYDGETRAFKSFARHAGYSGTRADYRREVERALRATILRLACGGPTPKGVCVRLINNNAGSQRLLERLNLPLDKIEVIEYFGSNHKGKSVKRAIQERSRPDLPFLIAVTNRARMGDAFPRDVQWFLEFSKKAANLNGLLQGLLGRACGYGKQSVVIMSEENCELVEDYKRGQGGYIYKTSRHSVVVGTFGRRLPTSIIRVRRDLNDPVVTRLFENVDREIVRPNIIQGGPTLKARRARDKRGYRTGPLLRIAEELGLFDYLERPDVRERLFPTYPSFRIVRPGEEVTYSRSPGRKLCYALDSNGDCRFTFREWTEGGSDHSGASSRGYGERDASDRDQAGDALEPQVNLRKFDLATGHFIDDKRVNGKLIDRRDRSPGQWRAEMITLPLATTIRELQAGEATYPVEHSPFAALMSVRERKKAGYG